MLAAKEAARARRTFLLPLCTREVVEWPYTAGGGGEQGTWASQKHSEAGYGRPVDRGAWTAKTVKRPRQQPAHPQYANYWAPLTRKRHIPPHSAQPQHTNHWAPRTRKRHQQEHRPQRLTESSDPTQHAKGITGDCPGPRKGATTRRNVTQGVYLRLDPPPPRPKGPSREKTKFRNGKLWSGHFWYTNFWVPDAPPPDDYRRSVARPRPPHPMRWQCGWLPARRGRACHDGKSSKQIGTETHDPERRAAGTKAQVLFLRQPTAATQNRSQMEGGMQTTPREAGSGTRTSTTRETSCCTKRPGPEPPSLTASTT